MTGGDKLWTPAERATLEHDERWVGGLESL